MAVEHCISVDYFFRRFITANKPSVVGLFPYLMRKRDQYSVQYSVIFIDVMSGNPKTWNPGI